MVYPNGIFQTWLLTQLITLETNGAVDLLNYQTQTKKYVSIGSWFVQFPMIFFLDRTIQLNQRAVQHSKLNPASRIATPVQSPRRRHFRPCEKGNGPKHESSRLSWHREADAGVPKTFRAKFRSRKVQVRGHREGWARQRLETRRAWPPWCLVRRNFPI